MTKTSVQKFAVLKGHVPMCFRKLKKFCEETNYTYIIFITAFTPFDSHYSKILRNSCDIVYIPLFCTLPCNGGCTL